MSIHRLIFSIRIFLIGVILSSCVATHPLPTITPTPTQTPRFVTVDCASVGSVPKGYQVICGYLLVPEDRADPNSRVIHMGVTVLKTRNQKPKPDPVLFSNQIFYAPISSMWFFLRWLPDLASDRDFVFFDQRGLGVSVPNLDCPEVNDWFYATLDDDPHSQEYRESLLAAHQACHDRLVKSGVNLSAYTTAATVADLIDLRVALGYSSWNIFSDNEGATLALKLMQQDPDGIRSIIFDNVKPFQVDWFTELGFNAEQGLNLLFKYCAEDKACNSAYPDLKSVFYEVVDKLNAYPLNLEVIDPGTGTQYNAYVNGGMFINVILYYIYWAFCPFFEGITQLPRMIYQTHDSKYDDLSFLVNISTWDMAPAAVGKRQEIYCSEIYSYSTLEKVLLANSRIELRLAEIFNNDAKNQFDICGIWSDVITVPVTELVAKSSIPILVQSGEFDWTTTLWMFKLFTDSSTISYYVEYVGGEGRNWYSTLVGDCYHRIMNAFLADPYTKPDIRCSQEKKSFMWALP